MGFNVGVVTSATAVAVTRELPAASPFDGARVLRFLRDRSIEGVEVVDDLMYARTLRLPHGPAWVRLEPRADSVRADLVVTDVHDIEIAADRAGWVFDLDVDPVAVATRLCSAPVVADLVPRRPGLRVPGQVDGFEIAVRAVVGQQVSVKGARTILGRIVAAYGSTVDPGDAAPRWTRSLSRLFPAPQAVAAVDPSSLPMPRSRGSAIVGLAAAVADGSLALDRSAELWQTRADLLRVRGVGPWTAGYIALRALGDRDVWLGSDLGIVHALRSLGCTDRLDAYVVDQFRPYASYATMHLWHHLIEGDTEAIS